MKDQLMSKLGVDCMSAFGLSPGKQHLGTEFGESGSVRVLCNGERLAGAVNVCDVLKFMRSMNAKGTGKDSQMTMPDVQSFLMNLSSEQLGKFVDTYPKAVSMVRMKPNTVVYIPQGLRCPNR